VEFEVFNSVATDVHFEVTGGTQTRNAAHKAGGATAFYQYGSGGGDDTAVDIRGVRFVDNVGRSSGAALVFGLSSDYVGPTSLAVSGCLFQGNAAVLNGGGVWTDLERGDDPAWSAHSGDATSMAACPSSPYR
jgi:hypothetical protein